LISGMEENILSCLISLDYKLLMADSMILDTAQAYKATLWVQDEHFKGLPSC